MASEENFENDGSPNAAGCCSYDRNTEATESATNSEGSGILDLPHGELDDEEMNLLMQSVRGRGIRVHVRDGDDLPPEALMHDRGAAVPALVVSPQSEWGVVQALELFKDLKVYGRLPISVKSGGHGYFNGASCSGIMLNLSGMTKRRIEGDTLFVEPGCVLGQAIDTLAAHRKAVPHGDCFGVGAGGHFLTAGWDLILARRYGLGCQSVVGGRIILWDGSVIEVDERNHPALLYAMRGGAAAGVGVVTELRLRLIDEPPLATWRFTHIGKEQLKICAAQKAFTKAAALPRDITMSFRFHFEPDQVGPVCSFNVVSLLPADETRRSLHQHLGPEVASLVDHPAEWNEKSIIDLRMLPASPFLAANPAMLAEASSRALLENPLVFWKRTSSSREMARSFSTSISYWVVPECEDMFLKLYEVFQSVRAEPIRDRIYALVIQGGGRISELQQECSMPLGQALARFESHWDDPHKDEERCRRLTDKIGHIMQSRADAAPGRPYRGDIWLHEQAEDPKLNNIFRQYDRRFSRR